jgi:hypothetical protein
MFAKISLSYFLAAEKHLAPLLKENFGSLHLAINRGRPGNVLITVKSDKPSKWISGRLKEIQTQIRAEYEQLAPLLRINTTDNGPVK